MLHPFESMWESWGVQDEIHRFALLLWDEMLDPHTLDTWQVRTMHPPSILSEISRIIDISTEYEPYKRNLPSVLAEADTIFANDLVIKNHYPFLRYRLSQLAKEKQNVNELQPFSLYALEMLKDYPNKCTEMLIKLLREGSNAKRNINKLMMAFATNAVNSGYSLKFLHSLTSVLTDNQDPDFVNRFEELVGHCSGNLKQFTCTIALSWREDIQGEHIGDPHVDIRKGKPSNFDFDEERNFYRDYSDNEFFAVVNTSALDTISASHVALSRVENACSIVSLYQPNRIFGPKGTKMLIRSEDHCKIISIPSATTAYWSDSRNASPKVKRLFNVLSTLDDKAVAEQFESCLRYHRAATVARTTEARLIDLWIAMECLAPRGGLPIIDRICSSIPHTVALQNIFKQVKGLAIYIRLNLKKKPSSFREIFPNSSPNRVEPEELLKLLLEKEDSERSVKLNRACSDNQLIRYRIHRLRCDVLAKPKLVNDNLCNHRQNVDWQLRRIYRARNELTHRGHKTPQVSHLVQHLNTYLLTTTQVLVNDLSITNGRVDLGTIFERRRLLLEYYLGLLKEKDCRLTSEQLLKPQKLFDSTCNNTEFAWVFDKTK